MSRRGFFTRTAAATAALAATTTLPAAETTGAAAKIVLPPTGKSLFLACKLGMIAKEVDGKKLTLVQRLRMAADAGFDGVDFDEAGDFTVEQARDAVLESGVFVHNAINHEHWGKRLTSPKAEDRAKGRANIEHCLRLSHAAGGSGVLVVIGSADDGPESEILERCRKEIKALLPLAGSLGQPILVENVWNKMMYDHDRGPDQSPDRFIQFVDSFKSPWVGMYYDIGNHWKYAQPSEWIRAFGHRCVKLDAKGFSRAKNSFTDITAADDDLPWDRVRQALADIDYHGWATCEVDGGDVKRLSVVRGQMKKAFGV